MIATCSRCIYWRSLVDDPVKKEGNCLVAAPTMIGSSRGKWPITLASEGCGQGWEKEWDEEETRHWRLVSPPVEEPTEEELIPAEEE